ncbi:MAG: hypothetical protein IJT09_02650 [Abditibacteriota bacterium]|nr:hypothetical protein [Abditibacteriota bacterium]
MTGSELIAAVIDGITEALYGDFPQVPIYADAKVVQSVSPPCFFIELLTDTDEELIKGTGARTYDFLVSYISGDREELASLYEVGDKLFDTLLLINVPGGKLRAENGMNFDIGDGAAHFRVGYKPYLTFTDNTPKMRTLYNGQEENPTDGGTDTAQE